MKKILQNNGIGMTDNNISDMLASNCLNTVFEQYGAKGNITLSRYLPVNQKPQCILLGKEYADMTDDEKKESEAYRIAQKIRQTINFLPKKEIKEIEAIEQQNLRKYKELCLGKNIMTQNQYEVMKNFLKVQDVKKMDEVNKIYNDWDNIINNFIEEIKIKFPYIDEQLIIDVAKNKIGDKEKFRNSYKTELTFMPLPSTLSATLIPDASIAQIAANNANQEAEDELVNAIGTNLNNLYQSFNKIVISNNNISNLGGTGVVAPKTKGTLFNAVALARANLSFLRIPELDNLLTDMENISKKDDKSLVSDSEDMLYNIYNFMNDYTLQDYLDLSESVVPEAGLELAYNQDKSIGVGNNTINTNISTDIISEGNSAEEVYW